MRSTKGPGIHPHDKEASFQKRYKVIAFANWAVLFYSPAMSRLQLSLLGPFQARVGERDTVHFATDKVRALLAYLAVEADRPHRRDTLATLLWPEWDDAGARANLRLTLHRLRETLDKAAPALSDGVFGITRETVQVNGGSLDVDVARFAALLEMCEAHPHRLLHLCPSCLAQLSEAADLYEGELLAGLSIADAPGFEQWELAQRAELEQRVLTLFYQLADAFEELGDHERAMLFARRQLAIDPYREEAHRQLMRCYARKGERAAALAHFDHARRILQEELGVEPDAKTISLADEVRQGKLTADHRGRPQCYHFPSQFTPFIGRATEVARLVARLSDRYCRLLTVVGPGGMGKTRLAIAAAEGLAERSDFPDGIYFMPLARTMTSDQLPSAMATVFGMSLAGSAQPADQLVRYLRPRRILVVLDNFEHLLDGLDLLVRLLEEAPHVRWLVTSRVALNIRAEERFALGGLDVDAASRLFIATAARVAPDFAPDSADLVAMGDICRAVGGMPLAVELSATWIRLMDVQTIAGRIHQDLNFLAAELRDVPERQRSMRAVFDQMWAQLSVAEAIVLSRLSILRGPFRLNAAEAVSDASPAELAALLDHSLISAVGMGWFEIHELLRQYAAERLAAEPLLEAMACNRHAAHYLDLLEQHGRELGGANSRAALAVLRQNSDNLRLAWKWAVDGGHTDRLATAARPLDMFYRYSGLLAEGAQTFAAASGELAALLDRGKLEADVTRPLLHELWRREALLRELRGDVTGALSLLEQTRDGWTALSDRRRLAQTLNDIAYVYLRRGRGAEASNFAQSALILGRELGDDLVIADALHNLGNIADTADDLSRAEAQLRESIARYELAGDSRWLAGAHCDLGRVLALKGELNAGRAAIVRGLAVAEAAGDQPAIVLALTALGGVVLNLGDLDAAAEYNRRGQIGAQEVGDPLMLCICLGNLGHVARERGQPTATRLYRDTISLGLEAGIAGQIYEALLGLASLSVAHQAASGTRWLAAAETWRKIFSFHANEEPFVHSLRLKTEEGLRAALGAAFLAVWIEGEAMTLEAAAAQAVTWAAEIEYQIG